MRGRLGAIQARVETMLKLGMFAAAIAAFASSFAAPAQAGQTNVAVAANFTEPAKEIAALFKQKTGHEAVLSFGASGPFFTQITHDAPFQVFLSADAATGRRPPSTTALPFPEAQFTYAIGKLVLWSKVVDVTKGDEALKAGAFSKLAIANPTAAPYGAAAIETMKALGVYDALQPKIVQGNSIAQAFQFVDTRNAEVGFVALSQLYGVDGRHALARAAKSLCADPAGRRAPEEGRERRGVEGLPRIPEGSGSARHHREIRLRPRLSGPLEAFAHIWQPVRLTLELATVTTLSLLVIATPLAWWLARSHAWWKEVVAAVVSLPMVLPPTVLGFYLLIALGPDGPGGAVASLWGARTLAFTFWGLVIGSIVASMPFVVQPIRNAFAAIGDRPLEVAATLRASPARAFWTVALPLASPGLLTGAVLGFAHTVGEFGVILMIGGNIPGRTRVMSTAIFDYVETMQWREANILAGGMVVFAFAVILSMILIEKRFARARA